MVPTSPRLNRQSQIRIRVSTGSRVSCPAVVVGRYRSGINRLIHFSSLKVPDENPISPRTWLEAAGFP
jgi:hypothetical protein